MTRDLRPMPMPPNVAVEVYISRVAYNRITTEDVQAAAKRLSFTGPLRWEVSMHKFPGSVPAASVRVTCKVAEATVLLEAFRRLVHLAGASQDDDLLIDCAEALAALMEAIDYALTRRHPR